MNDRVKTIPLKGIRGMIARALSEAWQAPRVAQSLDVDMSSTKLLLECERELSGRKITITHVLLKTVAECLKYHPALNGILSDAGIEQWQDINLGIAVNTENGVVVPVIPAISKLAFAELADELAMKAEGARDGKLPASAYQRGTFTISTLGSTGIDWFTPVLNPPQIAILGVGRMQDRPVVIDGELAVRPMMTLTLVFNHRAVDGYPAGLFLADVARRLEAGERG